MKRFLLFLSCAVLVFSLGILSSCTPNDPNGDDSSNNLALPENQEGLENSGNNTVDNSPGDFTER